MIALCDIFRRIKAMKIHHIGYLVKNIKIAEELFTELGFCRVSDITMDEYRNIQISFWQKDGYYIELVMPISESSVVYKLSKRIGASPYHLCYEVENLESAEKSLREQGYIPTGEAIPAPAIDGCLAQFFFHKDMGIIELIER